MQKYYSLETTGKGADLYIFGDITSYPWKEKDRDAYGIVKLLQDLDADEINVHINSYGGEVAEGLAIYNTLKNSRARITTYCDGFACSAASVVFMAGDRRVMNEAALLMIHNAWTYGRGDANELRKQAEDLDKITQASVNAYLSGVSISEEDLKKKMDDETWLTAEEALADGFATEICRGTEDGINQSALQSIREKLIAPAQKKNDDPDGVRKLKISVDDIAEKIMEKVKQKEETRAKERVGWDSFFMKGEQENED